MRIYFNVTLKPFNCCAHYLRCSNAVLKNREVFTKKRIETQFDGPLRMNFDAVDMAKYLNYGLNYKNTLA